MNVRNIHEQKLHVIFYKMLKWKSVTTHCVWRCAFISDMSGEVNLATVSNWEFQVEWPFHCTFPYQKKGFSKFWAQWIAESKILDWAPSKLAFQIWILCICQFYKAGTLCLIFHYAIIFWPKSWYSFTFIMCYCFSFCSVMLLLLSHEAIPLLVALLEDQGQSWIWLNWLKWRIQAVSFST